MRRGLWLQLLVILAVVSGLQVAALTLTCAGHWGLPATQQQHHHGVPAAAPPSHSHADGMPHDHEQCSLQGAPAVMLLFMPGFDCFCDGPNSITLLGIPPLERLTAVDDSYYERILLKLSSRPPIP